MKPPPWFSSPPQSVYCIFLTILTLQDIIWHALLLSGLAIEYWKVAKAFKLQLTYGSWNGISTVYLQVSEGTNDAVAEEESATSVFDKEATQHLLFVVVPLMVGYSAYALIHKQYKSFYSWLISSLVSFVYIFGNDVSLIYLAKMSSAALLLFQALCC